jgi:hypothetical protein
MHQHSGPDVFEQRQRLKRGAVDCVRTGPWSPPAALAGFASRTVFLSSLRTAVSDRWAAPGSTSDAVLRTGDQLIIPKHKQDVTVIGEVRSTNSHVYCIDVAKTVPR